MDRDIYEVNAEGIQQINYDDFHKQKLKGSSIYLYDIKIGQREEAVEELRLFGLDDKILNYILEPSEHIRFEYIGNVAYGELGHFSSESGEPLKYIGVIIINNILVFIYDEDEEILVKFFDSFPQLSDETSSILDPASFLYILMNEVLTSHSKLILSYREEIEEFAKQYRDNDDIDPKEFLESKSTLSDFTTAIEKLHFTLSFPPAKGILNKESAYRLHFQELLKTTDVLKESLRQMGQRLNALNDYHHLILQDKSIKRLNFLTIVQSIFVPLTLIAGLYGMNFVFMPELQLKYGYFIVLGIMLLIVSGFVLYFYKHGWFD